MSGTLLKNLIDNPIRKLTVAAGRETIGFITEYSNRRFAVESASGERIGEYFSSMADAAQVLSSATAIEASAREGGAK
jgi:hypothetical protein